MKTPKAWLRAWLGVDDAIESLNALTPIVLSTHKRLKVYESNVPAIARCAKSLREKHLRETQKTTLGESSSGEVA